MQTLEEKLVLAAEYIKGTTALRPKIGIILGSGLGEYGDTLKNPQCISYGEIPYFPLSTVIGHKGQFVMTENVICMQGRFHYYEGYDMDQVTFPIHVMKLLGVESLIVSNACGGVNLDFSGGDLMVITDHINFMGRSPLMGKNLDSFGTRFPDMTEAYEKKYQELALTVGKKQGLSLKQGVYMAFTGPNFETPAEVRMARIWGADAVGMSTVPEVIVAHHCGIKVLGISCISNMAAGVLGTPLSHDEVIAATDNVKGNFVALVQGIVEEMIGKQ